MESQVESGNQVPLSKEDEDRIFLQDVLASSHGRYMYETDRNKSSSFASDASTSLASLEAAYQRIRELESTQSQLQEEVRELRSNIQSSAEWRLQTEEMMRRMMEQMMEEREREVSSRSIATRWSKHILDTVATRCSVLSMSRFLMFNTLCF